MAEAHIVKQLAPLATTEADLYTVPASTRTIVSTVVVCNRSATATTFRLSVAPLGAVTADKHYLLYGVALAGNDTYMATIGMTLSATDVVRVYAGAATVSFSLFGVEVT